MATAFKDIKRQAFHARAANDTIQLAIAPPSSLPDNIISFDRYRQLNPAYDPSNVLAFRLYTNYNAWVYLEDRALLFNYLVQYGLPEQLAEKVTPVLYPHAKSILLDDASEGEKLERISTVFEKAVINGVLSLGETVSSHAGGVGDIGAATETIALPDEAPAVWATRDRATEKDPIAFLRKHWGTYMDAGVLYQDDISRLGDPTLVNTVRAWCSRQARLHPERADEFVANEVLPPPGSDRSLKMASGLSEEVRQAAYRLVQREKSAQSRDRSHG